MPNRRTTVVIIPDSTSRIRQFKLSRAFVFCVVCLLVLSAGAVGYMLFDYADLKNDQLSLQALQRQVTDQRIQIQTFAKKISSLKSEVIALHDFEKKIRVMANVEGTAVQDAVFGIGGPMSEDLKADLPVSERQDGLVRQMHAQVEYLQEASAVQKEAFETLHDYLESQKSLLASTPAIWPTVGWVSSGFGYRKSPFTNLREFHQGLDIATQKGTPVVAPADGTVTFVGRKGGLGKCMVIDHGHGMVTRYAHLDKYLIKRGAKVCRGDKIGLVGNTGRSTAPHLHYEVHLNGVPVNPKRYILN